MFGPAVTKALRVRSDGVRRFYSIARRAQRFLRDRPRRAVFRTLPSAGLRIPESDGFAVLPPGRFPELPLVIEEARASLAAFDARQPPGGKNRKRFLQNVLDPASLTLEHPVMRFALRPDVLAAVARYLGVVPLLTTVSVFHSDVVEGAPTSSQLHHCDGDDVTQIKIFVYCSDVDERSGPLTVLSADDSQRVRRRTRYQYRQRLTDEQVAGIVGTGREHAILGPAGTTAFVDTSRCFHYGSRVASDAPPRLVTMVQYQTPYSFMLDPTATRGLPFRHLARPDLGALERLVLGD